MTSKKRLPRTVRGGHWLGAGAALLLGVGCGGASARPAPRVPEPRAPESAATTVEVSGPFAISPTTAPDAPMELPPAATSTGIRAMAELMALDGGSNLGTVRFEQVGDKVSVTGRFTGLTPGLHGFTIHSEGDCGGKLAANAGPHFNPGKVKHGPIGSPVRHVGDFGNLTVDKDGQATFDMTTDSLTVSLGPDSVVGRAIVIHARKDDGKTQPGGKAGAAVACGVIAG